MRNHTFEEDACLNKPKKHCQAAEREAMLSVPGIFCVQKGSKPATGPPDTSCLFCVAW